MANISNSDRAVVRPNGQALKVHLGCGRRYIPGFVHIDVDDFPHIDYRHDIRRLPMLADGAAQLVYCCHALEYFDRVEVLDVLREWHRVLQPGGTIRLAVPDFDALVTLYQRTQDLNRVLGPLFGRIAIKESNGESVYYHRTTYDLASLSAVLCASGFELPRRYDWRKTEHAGVDDFSQAYYPHLDRENGLLISLNVEATKPTATS